MTEKTQIPVFVVSAGRSGSTFLARLIHDHPDIVCISDLIEPVGENLLLSRKEEMNGADFFKLLSMPSVQPRLRYWRERQTKERLFVPDDESQVSLLMSYTLPFADKDPQGCADDCAAWFADRPVKSAAAHLTDFFEWMKDRYSGNLWIERTGGSLPYTDKIIESWPDAKIVHNYRDGRECSISMWNYPFFRMYLLMQDNPDLDEWDFDAMPPIENMGKMWSDWVVAAEQAMAPLDDDKKAWISYEDLMSKPEETLTSFLKFIYGHDTLSDTDHGWIKNSATRVKPAALKFNTLSADDQSRLQNACTPGLEKLNYI